MADPCPSCTMHHSNPDECRVQNSAARWQAVARQLADSLAAMSIEALPAIRDETAAAAADALGAFRRMAGGGK